MYYVGTTFTVTGTFVTDLRLPDLSVSVGPLNASQILPGAQLDAPTYLYNASDSAVAVGTVVTRYWLSNNSNNTNTTGDTPFVPSDSRTLTLYEDAFATFSTQLTIPENTVPGTYFIKAETNDTGSIVESNYTNDLGVSGPIVISSPLSVDFGDVTGSLGSPPELLVGKHINIPLVISNNSNVDIRRVTVTLYLSKDGTIDSANAVGSRGIIILKKSESLPLTVKASFPESTNLGDYSLIAEATSPDLPTTGGHSAASLSVVVKQLSDATWAKQFPGSTSFSGLLPQFGMQVFQFIEAVKAAGAVVTPIETYRPDQRAYLMHYAWLIGIKHMSAKMIPSYATVSGEEDLYIEWWHGSQDSSEVAARQMVSKAGFGIDMTNLVPPGYPSNHSLGTAIDMRITWTKKYLTVIDGNGVAQTITGIHGNTNPTLISVAASYGVMHYFKVLDDKNHWSIDGH